MSPMSSCATVSCFQGLSLQIGDSIHVVYQIVVVASSRNYASGRSEGKDVLPEDGAEEGWDVRELQRQIRIFAYERVAAH